MTYLPVVGLEIHVQVKTKSKMFCRCKADYFGKEPNVNVCPVCFGLPGALPVPNKVAFEKAVKLAIALNCKINKQTKFDRKNYFYPDLPKGYQISQYDQPIGVDGFVEIEIEGDTRRIRVQRVHLEEDTGKSIHGDNSQTLLDYNKSGVPLLEIVTFPDFESVEEVILFAKRLRQIVRYVDLSDAEMQKGQMRFELNISVKPDNSPKGTLPDYKVEVKNIGSISVLEKVLSFEVKRQSELLSNGEKIPSQTRGLKGMSGETLFQRSKETADDYRYFPEPDIPPLIISDELIENLKSQITELPAERKIRYMNLGLEGEQADIFVESSEKYDYFEEYTKYVKQTFDSDSPEAKQKVDWFMKTGAKWIIGEITYQVEKRKMSLSESPINPYGLFTLLIDLHSSKISDSIIKNLVERAFQMDDAFVDYMSKNVEGKQNIDFSRFIEEKGLLQISDSSEVEKYVKQAIAENPSVVTVISKNPNAIKFLVGQVMRQSKGKVNPKVAEEELKKALNLN